MRGFELDLEKEMSAKDFFDRFVNDGQFTSEYHKILGHSKVSISKWDVSNQRRVEFVVSCTKNEVLDQVTGGLSSVFIAVLVSSLAYTSFSSRSDFCQNGRDAAARAFFEGCSYAP